MNFGATELLIILAIAAVLFGTKKLRSVGGDLGSALRGFRKALTEDENKEPRPGSETEADKEKEAEKSNSDSGSGN